MKEKFIRLEGLPYSSRLLPGNGKEKVALVGGKTNYGYKYDEKLLEFLNGLKPDARYNYILVNALGAGEYYGPNFNHDYFPEEELLTKKKDQFGNVLGYKSFLSAGVYRDHQNARQNGVPFGDVVCAVYNHEMHRVELVLRVDREKALKLGHEDIITAIDNGDVIQVSMAVLVPYDICSNCLNKSRQADGSDSCDCVKGELGHDGKKICMINVYLRFHDMSFVVIQGDSLGFMVEKVAGRTHTVGMKPRFAVNYGVISDGWPGGKSKQALKVKRINALSTKVFKPGEPILFETIHKACKGGEFEVLSFLALMTEHGIILSPAEFYSALASPYSKSLAKRFYGLQEVPVTNALVSPLILSTPSCAISDHIPLRRSIFSDAPEFPTAKYIEPKTYAFQKMAARYNDYRAGVAVTLARKLGVREKTAGRSDEMILAALIAETGASAKILKHINRAITA